MTLEKIYEIGLINDNTKIYIYGDNLDRVTHGKRYQDSILKYMNEEIEEFSWVNDNEIYIYLFQKSISTQTR